MADTRKMRTLLCLALAVILAGAVVATIALRPKNSATPAPTVDKNALAGDDADGAADRPRQIWPPGPPSSQPAFDKPAGPAAFFPDAAPVEPTTQANPQAAEIQVALAREALNFVGTDGTADEVWLAAINDPNLPAEARKDLIEDLNEDGFVDPDNVTADDLPLIVSRLRLIEQFAPEAMDEANADAFAEAYKDLANMYLRLVER